MAVSNVARENEDRVVSTLTLAFSADPVTRWLFPDPLSYVASFPRLTVLFGGRAFDSGTAHASDDFAGAALWLPPGVTPDEEGIGALVASALPVERQVELFALLGKTAELHPHDPHWYLPLIGVDPVRQGQGHGSALLAHALKVIDGQGLPAFLESSNPRNIPLYERHGFEVLATLQEGESPPITPMLRSARR